MKLIIYMFLSVLLITIMSGCCDDPVEIDKFPLSEEALSILPYSDEQNLEFEHSTGYIAKFIVTERAISWEIFDDDCIECWCQADYYSYQKCDIKMNCDYPFIDLEFILNKANPYNDLYYLDIQMNSNHVAYITLDENLDFRDESTTTTLYDSILLGSTVYYDVIEKKITNYNYKSTLDSGKIESIFYNKTFGLLQIKISDDETYTLK